MKTNILRAMGVGLGLLCVSGVSGAHASEINWKSSFNKAMDQAKADHKLVMVDFYTDWCVWCKKLDSDTYPNAKVVTASEQFVPVKVNAEKEGIEEAKKYNVHSYPNIVFINESGEVEGRIGGYMPADAFTEKLNKIAADHKEFPALLSHYQTHPSDEQAAGKLVVIYAGRGNGEKAEEILKEAEKGDMFNNKGYLTKAYNALGDYYQDAEKFDKAIPLFNKAAMTSKEPYDIVYADLSVAACYLSQKNTKDATTALNAALAVPNGPKDLRTEAQGLLDQIKKSGGK